MKSLLFIFLFFLNYGCSEKINDPKPENSINIGNENPFEGEIPQGCLAIDTDGDGVIDCLDPDIDGDGVPNEIDAFPYNPLEWIDTDGDGVGDNSDTFPLDPSEWGDNDNDGIGDNADPDDDNDGVPDVFEIFYLRFDEKNWTDIDSDLLGDQYHDPDKDNDGVPTIWDDFPWDVNEYFDIDGDRIGNNSDPDIDGDGVFNAVDAFPYDPSEWLDDDLNGIGNNIDPDDDNDGFPDSWEEFSRDSNKLFDTDGDGYSNEEDAFPFNPFEWLDSDGDGVGDNSDPFPFDSTEWADTDGDGVGDNSDPDIDGDGFLNCVPYAASLPTDSCNQDAFPFDPEEWADNDGDGIGDNADPDDDNDGVPDIFDDFPLNALHFSDFDKDGIPDSTFPATPAQEALLEEGQVFFVWDPDTDNDGVPNIFDDLPFNRLEYFDIDGDFIGNNSDLDIDGDGVPNEIDLFPYDSSEWEDKDEDGIGDNIDADDDNDGMPDLWDLLPNNKNGYTDFTGDGIPDQGNLDIDGDSVTNGPWECKRIQVSPDNVVYDCGYQTYWLRDDSVLMGDSSLYWCSYPKFQFRQIGSEKDIFIWDENEFKDNDYDCLGDSTIDPDTDNDGVPDFWDDFPNDSFDRKEFGYFDIDGDGIPSFIERYNRFTEEWELIVMDEDIDGDGVPNFDYECKENPSNPLFIQCFFVDLVELRDPITDELINTAYYDAFPYNPNEWADADGDGIGDNSDGDADGDGIINCIPYDMSKPDALGRPFSECNQDELPLVGNFHSFVFEEYDIDPVNVISYCADFDDCYFKNYDRDDDGLTDFEEYLLGTNPLVADTDGDGVPDIVERDEQTDPLDPDDWLDEDLDGIPNFLDKTPRGAFDESSLRTQISNASSCRIRTLEEICIDSQTGLCSWILTGGETEDPETGEFILNGECRSEEIRITEDIQIEDCFNLTGEVNLTSVFFNTITFGENLNTAPRCSGLITPFSLDVNASLNANNIQFLANLIDRLIYSEGKTINLENISIILNGESDNNVMAIEHVRPSDGILNIEKSTIKSIFTTVPQDFSPIRPMISAQVEKINMLGNIFYCDLTGTVPEIDIMSCIDTIASETNIVDNNFIMKGDSDNTVGDSLSYVWKHDSLDFTNISGENLFYSSFLSLELLGLGYNITDDDLYISEGIDNTREELVDIEGTPTPVQVPYSKYYLNNIEIETNFYNRFENEDFFADAGTNELKCSNYPFDPLEGLYFQFHPAYRSPTPLKSNLNFIQGFFFNEESGSLTPEGNFEIASERNLWANLQNEGEDLYDYSLLISSDNDGGFILMPASDPDIVGMGKRINSVIEGNIYEFSLNVSANNLEDRDIKMRVFIQDATTGEFIKIINIEFDPGLGTSRTVNEFEDINFRIPFDSDTVSERFVAPSSEIAIRIENSNIMESTDVRVNGVNLKVADIYNIQFPGVNIPFCNL